MSLFSVLARILVISSASAWMTPSSPSFPKPKSLRCLRVNLLVSCHRCPSEVMMP